MGNENSNCGCCKNSKNNEVQLNPSAENENINNNDDNNNNLQKIDSPKDLKSYVTFKNNVENSISHDENSFNKKPSSLLSNNNNNSDNKKNKILEDEKLEYDINILCNKDNKKKTNILMKRNFNNNLQSINNDSTKENINNQKPNLKSNMNKEISLKNKNLDTK